MKILDSINGINDIKMVDPVKYEDLAAEIRAFIIDKVSKNGGHLASNLGAVEITMALHLALDLKKDKIVWDVGHQSYTHKILTGRKDEFDTLRKLDGLSGFPKTYESEADCFNTGHSSTSLSAAYGFAKARDIKGSDETVVAVIGDGALSGGMAFEALNNIGQMKSNLIIILNDNKMSISENVGGLSKYLNSIRVGDNYNNLKGGVEQALLSIPKIGEPLAKTVKRSKDSLKSLVVPGMLFEDMGLTYVGPVDGHDINGLVATIEKAKDRNHPVIIHAVTKKGKGYQYAEKYPDRFHGIEPFDVDTGKLLKKKEVANYTDVFSKELVKMGAEDESLVAITAAMPDGTGLSAFAKAYPERFFDVGIAEEHAVTFAAGLAISGLKPVVAVYSSFLQRAYDQILHDVCLQNLHVVFAVDRSGLVGADGDTHQGIFDTSYLTEIPNMTVMMPKNRYELAAMLKAAVTMDGPVALCYSRGSAYYGYKECLPAVEVGKGEIVLKGKKVAVIAPGKMFEEAAAAVEKLKAEDINVTLVNPRFIKPIDYALIEELAEEHSAIVTVEDHIYQGGLGQNIAAYLRENNIKCKITCLAINDRFVEHGSVPELYRRVGIDRDSIVDAVKEYIKK